eukprot:8315569-Pyramimonas_sp.AAC.1
MLRGVPASQPVSWSVGQLVSQLVSQSVSRSVGQIAGRHPVAGIHLARTVTLGGPRTRPTRPHLLPVSLPPVLRF